MVFGSEGGEGGLLIPSWPFHPLEKFPFRGPGPGSKTIFSIHDNERKPNHTSTKFTHPTTGQLLPIMETWRRSWPFFRALKCFVQCFTVFYKRKHRIVEKIPWGYRFLRSEKIVAQLPPNSFPSRS